MTDPLSELLHSTRLTAVVDVGANPIDGDPPYKPMLERGLCTVVGFDPQPAALESLNQRKGPRETYLPYAVGDGSDHTLHICHAPGMTSLLRPDPRTLQRLPLFAEFGRIVSTATISTRTLDSIDEITAMDLLKIDVQGAELTVFRSGQKKLATAVAVQTEVSFLPLYEDQPSFGEVDLELRAQGFVPHALVDTRRWIIGPLTVNDNPRQPLNQLVEADLVYVRDFRTPDLLTDEQLAHLALIAHHCYRSFDLALHCLLALEHRRKPGGDFQARYLEILRSGPQP
jgi:FkbM family methyltransferase